MSIFSKILLTAWMGLISPFVHTQPNLIQTPAPTLGDYNVTGGGTYRLQSSISTTQNTITLSSFKEPVSNIKYTMSYLNSTIEYGTIDPNNNNSKEFISFTGINQNVDGTATLTGVVRGMSFSYPFTASTTLAQPHSGQSIFILSNSPQLYEQFGNKNNAQLISGLWSFTTNPYGNSVATSSNQLITKAYADGLVASGVATSTETQFGGVWLASQLMMASSTYNALAPAALYSRYSTSSPYTSGLFIPITRNDGKLSPLFFATTSNDTYRLGGLTFLNGATMITASSTHTATTSINASSVTNNALILNGIPYSFGTTRSASSTVLTEDGSGNLSFQPQQVRTLGARYVNASVAGATTTLATVIIPANSLGATSGWINIKSNWANSAGGQTAQIDVGNGTATTTAFFVAQPNAADIFNTEIMPVSAAVQNTITYSAGVNFSTFSYSTTTLGTVSQQLYIAFRGRTVDGNALTLRSFVVTLMTP